MSLLNRLRQLGIEDRDIERVLSFASGGSARIPFLGDIEFISGGAAPELFARVRFKNGRISRLELGRPLSTPEAQDALIARARAEALDDHGSVVVTRVLFSQQPLKGTYCWENRLTQLFNRHLKRYGKVLTSLEKQRGSLYDIRSALVHGSRASRVDIDLMSLQETDRDRLLLLD
jgi:hypothetical protein